MIELKENGDIDVKKLTQDELEALVDIRLDIELMEMNRRNKKGNRKIGKLKKNIS